MVILTKIRLFWKKCLISDHGLLKQTIVGALVSRGAAVILRGMASILSNCQFECSTPILCYGVFKGKNTQKYTFKVAKISILAKKYFFPLKKSKILRKISRSGRFSSHLDLVKYSKCQTTPYIEKNKLLLNEYLGNFRHF